MKKLYILATIFLMGFGLCACQKNDNVEADKSNTAMNLEQQETIQPDTEKMPVAKIVDFPKLYSDVINDVVFETTLEVPDDLDFGSLKKSTGRKQYPDTGKTLDNLTYGREITEETEHTGSGEYGSFSEWYGTFSDGSTLSVGLSLIYNTTTAAEIDRRFSPMNNAEQFSQDKSFEFASPEQAFNLVKDAITQSGLQIQDYNYSYYALDQQTLQSQAVDESLKSSEPSGSSLNAVNDAYYFYAEQKYQGLPVYFGMADFPEDYEAYRPIQAIYTSNGLEKLYVTTIYNFIEQEEQIQLLDFSDIAENIGEKYGNILTGATYRVDRAKLYQMPVRNMDGDYDMKIAWFIECTESGTDSETGEPYEFQIYSLMDAETGEELTI